jgi:hypothetical protein
MLPNQSEIESAAESLRHAGYDVQYSSGTFTASDPWGLL